MISAVNSMIFEFQEKVRKPTMNGTRLNEFGSLTARKNDTSPIKSIFCYFKTKRPLKNQKGHINATKDHERQCKTTKGRTRPC